MPRFSHYLQFEDVAKKLFSLAFMRKILAYELIYIYRRNRLVFREALDKLEKLFDETIYISRYEKEFLQEILELL